MEEHQQKNRRLSPKVAVPLALIAIAVVAGGAYLAGHGGVAKLGVTTGAQANIATVNGAVISTEEFNSRLSAATSTYVTQGVNVADAQIGAQIRSQVLDELINEQLIQQYAQQKGIAVTDAEVQTAYQQAHAPYTTDDAWTQALQQNHLTDAEFRENLKRNLLIQKVIQSYGQPSELAVSDEEVAAAYKQLATQQQNLPPLDQVKAQIQAQLSQQKMAAVAQRLIAQLRSAGSIQISPDEQKLEAAATASSTAAGK